MLEIIGGVVVAAAGLAGVIYVANLLSVKRDGVPVEHRRTTGFHGSEKDKPRDDETKAAERVRAIA